MILRSPLTLIILLFIKLIIYMNLESFSIRNVGLFHYLKILTNQKMLIAMIASKLSRTLLRCHSTAAAAIAYNSKNVPIEQTKVSNLILYSR